jgi:lipoate-protein ligase B
VSRLEKTIIDTCSKYNIKTNTTENTGVWVGQDYKIAALGVHLQRYVSSHGLALNCNVDLDWFDKIVPCGLTDKYVTSISKETNKVVTPVDVIPKLVESFQTTFEKKLVPVTVDDILSREIRNKLDL